MKNWDFTTVLQEAAEISKRFSMNSETSIAILGRAIWLSVSRFVTRWLIQGQKRTLLALGILFFAAVAGLLWHQARLQRKLIRSASLQNAARYTEALKAFRTLYTSEVVETVMGNGIEVTHDYQKKKMAIPLPATLSLLLGNLITERGAGGKTRLYSPYPFPWRRDTGGLRDDFARQAWDFFEQDPESAFFRFENRKGRSLLRYATADVMRAGCVNCHNTYPDTPKKDWKTGDVRGILEITLPLDGAIAQTQVNLRESFLVTGGVALAGLFCVALLLTKQRRMRVELAERVAERTSTLVATNEKLKTEIAERKGAEARLRLQSAALQAAANAIVITDHDGSINWVNPAFTRFTGYTLAEAIGQKTRMLNSSKHEPAFYGNLWQTIQRGEVWQGEIINRRKDGSLYTEEMTITPVCDDEGEITNFVAIKQDITERKTFEQELQSAHFETERLLASISSILIGVDPVDRLNRWNAAAEQTFGIKEAHVVGKSFLECGIQWDWPEVLAHISECRDKDQPTHLHDIRFTRVNGKEGFLDITMNPIVSDTDDHAGYLLLATETTERRALESQLSQAQKLESIGQLAAGIAHEINTPIQYVGDNIRFLNEAFRRIRTVLDKDSELLDAAKRNTVTEELITEVESVIEETKMEYMLEEIPMSIDETLGGVKRVATIVRAMKEFSHPGAQEKTLTDINKALENTITVANNEWKYVAEMEKDFDPELPLVSCLPGEVNQVFLNVIVNAAHAIDPSIQEGSQSKGVIKVSTASVDNWVEIKISDSGSGIPKAVRAKIFDPFFTTKEVGKGTGQGLAIAHNVVVEKHEGSITFETEMGIGTTFIIRLPHNA